MTPTPTIKTATPPNIGVAKSTVQRYEKGTIEKIKLPVIESIARVLDVNPARICCKSNTMTCYSSLDTPIPSALENANASNSEQIDPDEIHLLTLYRELNEEGREKLVDYADDMVRSGKYKKIIRFIWLMARHKNKNR